MKFLTIQWLLDLFHFCYILRRFTQLLVQFRMRRHVGKRNFLGVWAVSCCYVFQETITNTIVYPVCNVVQAWRITVDFSITVADFLQIGSKIAFSYLSVFGRREGHSKSIFYKGGAIYFITINDKFFFAISNFQRMCYVRNIQKIYSIVQHGVVFLICLSTDSSYTKRTEQEGNHCFHCSFVY